MTRLREPASAIIHLLGALLSLGGLAALVYRAAARGTVWHEVSFSIFGVSLVLLYTASTLYHGLRLSPRGILMLRRIDHMMIYLLIAGSYTPFCLVALRGAWGWSLFGVIWFLAVLGAIVKLVWMGAPRWVSTGFYLLMGWLVVVAARPLIHGLNVPSLAWLAVGGLFYTVGAIFYAARWPSPWPGRFGFHEIWHLFVLAGSSAHVVAVLALV